MSYWRNRLYFGKNTYSINLGLVVFLLIRIPILYSIYNNSTFIAIYGSNSSTSDVFDSVLALSLTILGLCFLITAFLAPTDAEYDAAVENHIPAYELFDYALEKLGLDETEVQEIDPVVLGGYEFIGADKFKQGRDGKWRSNVYEIVMLLFTQNELHAYTVRFMTTEDLFLGEGTDTYFYKDIVSVSTASTSEKVVTSNGFFGFFRRERYVNSEAFKLTTKGGTSITVHIRNTSYTEQSVKAMRALLREKKQA